MNVILATVPHMEVPDMDESRQVEMEQRVVDYLDEKRKKLKMSVEDWAVKVYPGIKPESARMRLQGLRVPQGANGKRKRLLYSEFVLMAKALKLPPSEVVTLISHEFDELNQ